MIAVRMRHFFRTNILLNNLAGYEMKESDRGSSFIYQVLMEKKAGGAAVHSSRPAPETRERPSRANSCNPKLVDGDHACNHDTYAL